MASLATALRNQPRRRLWGSVAALAVLAVVATSWTTGVPFWTSDPVEAVGGGPPPADLGPPIDATTITPVEQADIPATDTACKHLAAGQVTAALSTEITNTAPCTLTSTSGGITVTVSVVDGPFEDAFVTEAESWPQVPEVVADPWSALFFLDAERSALLVDGGGRSLLVQLTDTSRDRASHLDALTALARLVLD